MTGFIGSRRQQCRSGDLLGHWHTRDQVAGGRCGCRDLGDVWEAAGYGNFVGDGLRQGLCERLKGGQLPCRMIKQDTHHEALLLSHSATVVIFLRKYGLYDASRNVLL